MLYVACANNMTECNISDSGRIVIPTISDVIALPFFDRIFILLNTIYFMGVHQVSVRSYYKRMHDSAIDFRENTILFNVGMTSCVSLPMIGIFDCINFKPFHFFFAGAFFLSAGYYSYRISNLMYEKKSFFPKKDHEAIDLSYNLSYLMLGIILALILSAVTLGTSFWVTPAIEWVAVFLNMNYFSFINLSNPFYDSVHQEGDESTANAAKAK